MDTKYLRQIALHLLTALLSVAMILYVCYHLFYGLTQKVETAPALLASVSRDVQADAYLFRDELPLASDGAGSRVPAVADGERVARGQTVSRTYAVSAPDTVLRIAGLDEQLAVLARMREAGSSVRDTASIDASLYGILQRVSRAAQSGSCEGLLTLRASLVTELNRRAIVTGASTLADAEASVRAERDRLTAELGACRAETAAPVSGYYYSETDGFERTFTADAALSMTPAEFDALTASAPSRTDPDAGKIAESYLWYAACRLRRADAAALSVGNAYSVSFSENGGKTLSMKLERAVPDGEDVLLVFSSGRLPENFAFTRSQTVSVSLETFTGLRLPASALRVADGVSGVYILRAGVVHFRAARILYEAEDYFLADDAPGEDAPGGFSWLKRNDIVITKGKGLREGRVLS